MDEGKVWAAIRGELNLLRNDLKAAVEAKQHEVYEVESAHFDQIARKLARAVVEREKRETGESWLCADCPYYNAGPICTKCGTLRPQATEATGSTV